MLSGCESGTAVIHRLPLVTVMASFFAVTVLVGSRIPMALMLPALLIAIGPGANAAVTIEAEAGIVADNDAALVDVVDNGHVDVGDGAIVEKLAPAPLAAVKADARVAVAVVDSAIEADVRSPIAAMPDVEAVSESPVTGSPEQARLGSEDPCSGNPEIAVRAVSPVAGRPNVTRAGANWLSINGKRRRADANGNAHSDLRVGNGGNRQSHDGQKEQRNAKLTRHSVTSKATFCRAIFRTPRGAKSCAAEIAAILNARAECIKRSVGRRSFQE